jgi:hypothetical protein
LTPRRGLPSSAVLACLALLVSAPLGAETIILTSGQTIEADRAWFDGPTLRYEKGGDLFALPRALVSEVHAHAEERQGTAPEVAEARRLVAAGDPQGATRALGSYLIRHPRSLAALVTLSEALLAMGDARSAELAARRATHIDPACPACQAVHGDALAALGESAGAQGAYVKSLSLHHDPAVRQKLAGLPPYPGPSSGARLTVRFDGSVNEPLGNAVLEAATAVYADLTAQLGFSPGRTVPIVLQTEADFRNGRVPGWASGWNDGTVKLPVHGVRTVSPGLMRVLRHELAHSFVSARTAGNSPTWLQEGIAQWLEGADIARADADSGEALRSGRMLPLLSLEGPFDGFPEKTASLAYAESLSAVAHIRRTQGEEAIPCLLAALGNGLSADEALPAALGIGYAELQQAWDAYLRRPPETPR